MINLILKILILAAVIVIVAYIMGNDAIRGKLGLNKETGKLRHKMHELNDKLALLDQKMVQIENRQAELENSLKSIESKIETLFAKIDKLERDGSGSNQPSRAESQVKPQPQSQPSQPVQVTKYVQQLGADGFEDSVLLDNLTKFTKFVVEVSGNTAKYEVPTSPECQEKLLNGFASISSFVEEVSHEASPTRIENVAPGTLALEGGFWKVTSKLKIKLV